MSILFNIPYDYNPTLRLHLNEKIKRYERGEQMVGIL